jgi:hypothetical protein
MIAMGHNMIFDGFGITSRHYFNALVWPLSLRWANWRLDAGLDGGLTAVFLLPRFCILLQLVSFLFYWLSDRPKFILVYLARREKCTSSSPSACCCCSRWIYPRESTKSNGTRKDSIVWTIQISYLFIYFRWCSLIHFCLMSVHA